MGRDRIVVRTIDRAAPASIAGLAQAGVATVHEAYGRRGLLDPGIRPIQSEAAVAGSAVTVRCVAGDNMMIHAAVEVVEPGDVLVIVTDRPSTHGMVGDLLATSLMTRGCSGVVIDAGVRDVSALRSMGFPVWARVIHAEGTVKETPGAVNVPIELGGVPIHPGDVVVADDDGVAIVARADAEAVLAAAQARFEKEATTRRRLEQGELGVDFYDLRIKLEDLGVRWVDRLDEN